MMASSPGHCEGAASCSLRRSAAGAAPYQTRKEGRSGSHAGAACADCESDLAHLTGEHTGLAWLQVLADLLIELTWQAVLRVGSSSSHQRAAVAAAAAGGSSLPAQQGGSGSGTGGSQAAGTAEEGEDLPPPMVPGNAGSASSTCFLQVPLCIHSLMQQFSAPLACWGSGVHCALGLAWH